jgi:hypothetical protein
MIELIKTSKFPGDIMNDVKSGKIHVVCMGQNGLTHLNVYAELYCKIPKAIVNECVDLVNSKKETGTLFPKAYLSILPKSERKIDRIKNPLILSFKELEKCIYDVFEANQKYLKSEIIYFSLESWYIDECTALDIIQKKIAEEANADLHVKTIWFQCG